MDLYFHDQRTIILAIMIGLDFLFGTIAALVSKTWSLQAVGRWFLSNVITYGFGMSILYTFALTIASDGMRDAVIWFGYIVAYLALIGSFVLNVQEMQNRPAAPPPAG